MQAAQQGNANASGGGVFPGSFGRLMFGVLLFFVVFYFVLFRSDRKKRRQNDDMISGLKKNDKVVTIGGIVGTVVSTKEDEVVVKVDESSNIKMTFVRKAIQRVVTADTAES